MKDVVLQAIREASVVVKEKFGTNFSIMTKHGNETDLVTEVDLASEKIILNTLKSAFPTHGFFSEEAGKSNIDAPYVWMIDPLDGTTNFSHGIPCVSISMALIKDGEVIFGVVANPITDEIFYAEKGKGAFLNDQPIHVSNTTALEKAFVSAEWWSRNGEYKERGKKLFNTLADRCSKIRYLSGTVWSLTRVARGLIDVETCDTTLLDVAAVALIIQEAGGVLTDHQGNQIKPFDMEIKRIVAANPALHKQVLSLIS